MGKCHTCNTFDKERNNCPVYCEVIEDYVNYVRKEEHEATLDEVVFYLKKFNEFVQNKTIECTVDNNKLFKEWMDCFYGVLSLKEDKRKV